MKRDSEDAPGAGANRTGAEGESDNGNNKKACNANPVIKLAVERAIRLEKSLPAREAEIHAKVLRQLQDCGLSTPDHFLIVVNLVCDARADAERMAREKDGSVLICDVNGKILAYSWPNGDGSFSKLLEYHPERQYRLEDFDFLFRDK